MLAGVTAPLVVAMMIGYLLGSLPIASWVARRHGIADLRTVGDHNPGFWNAQELLGWRAALPIFAGDVAKGAAAAALGAIIADRWWAPYLTGGAAMIGHAFPAFAGLRGGRSVLTFVGTAIVAAVVPAIVTVGAVLAPLWLIGRRFDRAARVGVATFPLVQLVLEGPRRTLATGCLMTFVGVRFAQAWIIERRRTTSRAT